LERLVDFVEMEVRQQRAERRALRQPDPGRLMALSRMIIAIGRRQW
jgi:hypothetical protein